MSDSSETPQKTLKMDHKVFNDPIHGTVELHPLLIKIIDTPQFQRLRNIKQLGGAYFVYPGASHNRFEHSIGVGHLAGQLVEALRTRQPKLYIDDRDVLCVKIAGLCHDLGHGPFSHLYDQMFITKVQPKTEWKHEDNSVKMFDHLVESNDLELEMKNKYGLTDDDLNFIKKLIEGLKDPTKVQWSEIGRTEDKFFLFEIVANKTNGIDVDKFDYFARDCYHLGMKNNFDHLRFIQFARVIKVEKDGLNHICSRDKEVGNLYDMFYTRNCLHRRAYQHRVNKIIEYMIAEAFLKANKHIKIEGSGGKEFTLSTARGDMEAYTKLTDHVFEQILELDEAKVPNSSSVEQAEAKKLAEAKEILERIISRDHYRFLGEIKAIQVPTLEKICDWKKELDQARQNVCPVDHELEPILNPFTEKTAKACRTLSDAISQTLLQEFPKETQPGKPTEETYRRWERELAAAVPKGGDGGVTLTAEDFVVLVTTFDYGMKDKDPIKNVYFYNKINCDIAFTIPKDQVSKLLPECFSEQLIRVYSKKKKTDDQSLKAAKNHLLKWCEQKGLPKPQ
ncbi:deoxynucleoside triphosphate triphosphohydrolase SAMHD1-like [Perca fluviatilis]|uniref:deoxynucleoside triphosphate triphosphohydrolase SAMHD1-like n=1 Tax=Perca fluviatilis TaxID=8168 RepID=UPI001962BEBD|nr:deoxynucleoside triphosphate triphosphohydrolase SAMHD1-like [Perca fluviatilis]